MGVREEGGNGMLEQLITFPIIIKTNATKSFNRQNPSLISSPLLKLFHHSPRMSKPPFISTFILAIIRLSNDHIDHVNHINININTNALFHPSHLSSTRLKDLEVVGLGLVILVKEL